MLTQFDFKEFSATEPAVQRMVKVLALQAARKMRLPLSASEDISQTVLMKVAALPQEKRQSIRNIVPYLVTIVKHEALDLHSRDLHSSTAYEMDPEVVEVSDSLNSPNSVEARILLKEVLGNLNDGDRNLFRLMILGYNEKEIAMRLNISHVLARKRVSRLREKIISLLE